MNLQGLSAYITALLSILLGTIVYFKNRERRLNQTWCLLSICVAIWSFFYGIMVTTSNQTLALFSARILNYGAIFIPIFYLHFIFCLLSQEKCRKTFINTAYILAIFLLAVTVSFPKYFVPSVSPKFSFRYYTNPGFLFYIYMAFWMFYVTYPFIILCTSIKKHSGLIQNQLKYVMIASIMGFTAGATTFLGVYSDKIYPFGMPFIFLYLLVITYAIVKYRLMDISIVIKKSTVYGYLSFLVLIPAMVVIIFAQKFFFSKIDYSFTFLVFVMFFLVAILFLKIKPRLEESVEKKLFKRKYEYKKTLSKLSKIVISFLDETELLKKTSSIFIQDLEIENISFFLISKGKRVYTLRAFRNIIPKIRKFPQNDIFFKWLKEDGKIIVKEELERFRDDSKNKLIVERLNSMESEVCIPLITRDELIGIVNLGKKRSGDMYSHEDLELLANFANQAAIALQNARLYEDMKKTQLLMHRTDRLAALGSLTAGLAHEIRNPLVAVNTFLQLLPERFEDKEFREEFLKLTTSEVERITNLVTNLLNFAKPSEPKLSKTDVNEVIEKVIDLIRVTAKKKGVIINTKLEKIPQAMLDEEQIKQVFLNIFLNAIEAISNEGSILVTSRSIQKNGLEYVQVEIEDTGKGIPKRILDQIFDPFFTTKEKGSGLGLSISHQIVQEHNGFIEVESKLGEGTTFFVNLPCAE